MFFITNSRQNKQKERKTGFSTLETRKYWSSSPSRSRRRSSTRKTFSLFLSLSLCWEKIHSPRRQLLTHFVQCTSQRSAKRTLRITLYNHRQHHHLPSKGRERERSEISLSRAPRESNSSAPGRDTKQKNLSLLRIRI